MKLLYFHGFGSSKESLTAHELSKHFDLDCITYDTSNAIESWQTLDRWVEQSVIEYSDLILVGSSLGGFWANIFGQYYGVETFLINPSLAPSSSLSKYNQLTEEELLHYRMIEKYLTEFRKIPRTIFLGGKDEVVNFDRMTITAVGSKLIDLPEEGHVLKDLTPVINSIIQSQNQITDDTYF